MHVFVSMRLALASAVLFLSARAACAGGNGQDVTPEAFPALLRGLIDPGGLRSQLEEQGVKFTFVSYGDAFDNPIGGIVQGPGYDGRFAIVVDANLQKLAGWAIRCRAIPRRRILCQPSGLVHRRGGVRSRPDRA